MEKIRPIRRILEEIACSNKYEISTLPVLNALDFLGTRELAKRIFIPSKNPSLKNADPVFPIKNFLLETADYAFQVDTHHLIMAYISLGGENSAYAEHGLLCMGDSKNIHVTFNSDGNRSFGKGAIDIHDLGVETAAAERFGRKRMTMQGVLYFQQKDSTDSLPEVKGFLEDLFDNYLFLKGIVTDPKLRQTLTAFFPKKNQTKI